MQDPSFVTSQEWATIAKYLHSMWLYLLVVLGFFVMFLMGHAVVPSLLATKEVRPEVRKMRPLFYLGALVSVALAGFFLASGVNLARVVETIYPRWWI